MARILQVCNADFTLNMFLSPLVRALVRRGHAVECVCDGTDIDKSVIPEAVKVHSIPVPRKADVRAFYRSIRSLRKIIREGKFDCVNSHNRNGSIVGRISAWLENVPVKLYTAHGFYFHDDQRFILREATVGIEALLALITDHTLSQSQADADLMVGRRLIGKNKISIIRNGIDTRRFSPRLDRPAAEAALGLRPDRFRVSATGRLVRGKGFSDLLDAFEAFHRDCPSAELVIIGGNFSQDIAPFQEQFRRAVRAKRLADRVIVTGITKGVESYLAASDAFVLPSYREGMPRAVLEALAMELPVIATDIRGCNEIIVHGENGFLYPPHDVARLSELLRRVWRESGAAKAMGKNGRRTVVARFDEKDYVRVQVETIERLIGSK